MQLSTSKTNTWPGKKQGGERKRRKERNDYYIWFPLENKVNNAKLS